MKHNCFLNIYQRRQRGAGVVFTLWDWVCVLCVVMAWRHLATIGVAVIDLYSSAPSKSDTVVCCKYFFKLVCDLPINTEKKKMFLPYSEEDSCNIQHKSSERRERVTEF